MKSVSRSVRWQLTQMLLVCVLPLGLFGAVLLFLHWQSQENERERAQIESARVLSASVDNTLDSSVQRLSILAGLLAATPPKSPRGYEEAKAALAAAGDWENLLLWEADGRGVWRLDRPFGEPVPALQIPGLWTSVLERGEPFVSDGFISPSRGNFVIAVGVPVMRGGKVTHLLAANLRSEWFDELLRKQGIPEGGVAAIFDRNWKFVARSHEGGQRRGTDPSHPLVEDMKRQPEGIGRYDSLNGVGVFTAWTGTRHGWWVAHATPASPIEAAFWRYLAVFGLLWILAMVGGAFLAVRKARRIAWALERLAQDASQLARGRPGGRPASVGVLEADRALEALELAGGVVAAALAERERALATEREARALAERANRAKDEFLAMLGHELRNPVGAISNSVSILRNGPLTETQRDLATGIISRQSLHLRRLIDDLLDVGRAMTGKIVLEREALDLAACVRHVLAALETRLAERQLDVALQPAWILGDPTRVEQIVANLLNNAVSHTSPGGRIRVEAGLEDGDAVLRVTDDGVGIAADDLPRLFDLFYQADTSPGRTRGGLGIGLTLVQRLALLHEAKVAAHSDGPGRGARFSLRFPAIPVPASAGVRDEAPQKRPMSLI